MCVIISCLVVWCIVLLQWMPEKEDLETMWIQLEAERTQKRKLQQRLQQTEDDAAEVFCGVAKCAGS